MSNVVAFKKTKTPMASVEGAPRSMTLFIHIKQTTLIAHCGDLDGTKTAEQNIVGESRL